MNLLQMSFSGAAFITAVVIIRAVAINKLPKKTFLVLWELVILRLLIPFSIPSMFSIYTLVTHSISSTTLPEAGTDYNIPTMQGLFVTTQGVEQPPADISSSVSMWFIVWCAGIIIIALFFVISYLRCLIEFRTALPVHNHYVEKWLAERPLKRPIFVRQSDRILAPLTYGIFRPVILMPKKMDWNNEKQWELTDTEEYHNLLEKFSQNTALYEQKDSNEIASFLFYTLEPLTAEKWQTRDFGGGMATDYPGTSDNAMLEFVFSLTIQNADTLTVGEYRAARLGVASGLQNILQGKTKEQLQNDSFMQEAIHAEIEKLNEQWNTDKLQISVDYSYMPLSEPDTGRSGQETIEEEQERREYPNGTEEDYHSLLDLKTADYQTRSVADFNMDLLEWANESYERMERINIDIGQQDFSVNLDSDELSFVALTTWLSGVENGKYVQSIHTGRKEEDPIYNPYLPSKTTEENGYGAWCDLFYQFSYHIADKKTLTVGERDDRIGNMMNEIQDFWDRTDMEEMLSMTENDIISKLKEIAAEYSNANITIIIREDSVSFEKMDERNRGFPEPAF